MIDKFKAKALQVKPYIAVFLSFSVNFAECYITENAVGFCNFTLCSSSV